MRPLTKAVDICDEERPEEDEAPFPWLEVGRDGLHALDTCIKSAMDGGHG